MPSLTVKLMRILFVIPAIGDVYGGPSKTVIDLAQALNHQEVTVDIVTTNANGSSSLDISLQKWLNKPGYRIQYFPYLSIRDYKWSTSFANWLFRHVRDYDLVHSNAIFSLPNAPAHWACQRYGIPYIMTPHGMLEPWALSYKGWKKKLYYSLLERPALNRASAIQTLASAEASHIQNLLLKSPMVVIPNGIHQQDFANLPDPNFFYQSFPSTRGKAILLFLGRIDPKKGLDLLAPAFAQIRSQFPSAHLVIAGPDNIGFLPTAQSYFAKEKCFDDVTFTGMLTGNLKLSALAAASVYVAPSYSEGFSVSVLEGMASGLPCVITTACNFPEAAQAEAAHVVEIEVLAIAKALRYCLHDPEAAQAIGKRARQFVFQHYSWENIGQQMLTVYQDILLSRSKLVSTLN
ncbi:MAG: glycosyltransferase [Phormidesmis sp.]